MKAKELRWLFLLALLFEMAVLTLNPSGFGISAAWTNGRYAFSGGTSPQFLSLATLIIALYLLLMFSAPAELSTPVTGIFRRFVAAWIDLWLAMMAIGPFIGILPIVSEWKRTGSFSWNVYRTTYSTGDAALTGIALSLFAVVLIAYFSWPLVREKPTPGSCVLGYRIVADDAQSLTLSKAIRRTLLAFVVMAAWYLAPFLARDKKKGKIWLDKLFATRAVSFR